MFWLAKMAGWLAVPPGLFLLLAGAALLLSLRRRRRGALLALAALIGAIYLLSIQPVADALLWPLEERYPPPDGEEVARCQAIALLGGGLSDRDDPAGRHLLSRASVARAVIAFRLWRRHRAPIVLSGGEVLIRDAIEAEGLAGFLADLGVPAADLRLERESRSTWDNGRYTRGLAQRNGWSTLCLVTSAAHLPRAVWTFRRLGLEVVPVPADYLSGGGAWGWHSFFPLAGALGATTTALHEYLGLAYYLLRHGG